MKVYIEQIVHNRVEQFYEEALLKHDALDELTVIKKIQRLYEALEALGEYAYIYPLARLKSDWIKKGYREYICEDFHFAYQIYYWMMAKESLGFMMPSIAFYISEIVGKRPRMACCLAC